MDKTVFIICHTLLNNVARSASYRDQHDAMKLFNKWLKSSYIINVVMEIQSNSSDCKSCTSTRIYEDLLKRLGETHDNAKDYVEALHSVIKQIPGKDINQLDINEGIIVIADDLFNEFNKNPVIITDMKPGLLKVAQTYYEKLLGVETSDFPFSIYSLDEAIGFLKGRYEDECKTIKERDTKFNVI